MLAQQIILSFKRLAGFAELQSVQATQAPTNSPIVFTTPNVSGSGGNDSLFCPLLGYIMTLNEHAILTKFL